MSVTYWTALTHSSYKEKVIRGSGNSLRYDFKAPSKVRVINYTVR